MSTRTRSLPSSETPLRSIQPGTSTSGCPALASIGPCRHRWVGGEQELGNVKARVDDVVTAARSDYPVPTLFELFDVVDDTFEVSSAVPKGSHGT